MYDRIKAIEYAKKWAYDYNPRYYDFTRLGGDCTNFVSQCLYAGGITMNYSKYGWYYISLNNRAPAFTGVNEFWDFGISNKGVGYSLIPTDLSNIEIGDVIQLTNGERFYHNLIVSSVLDEIRVASHDNDAFNRPLKSYYFYGYRCAKVKKN